MKDTSMGRHFTLLFVFTCAVLLGIETSAQVTNLKVNGSTSNFILPQEMGVTWECNIPTGGSAEFEVWLHIGGSTFIDPSTDKSIFGTGMQTDGDLIGNNGPPDMDGLVNGHMSFTASTIHLAPGTYIFKFTNNGVTSTIKGIVVSMAAPAYTIAGKFIPGAGQSAANLLCVQR